MNTSVKKYQYLVRIFGSFTAPVFMLMSDYHKNMIYIAFMIFTYGIISSIIRYKTFSPELEVKLHKRMLYVDILMLTIALIARGGIRSDFYLGYYLILGYILLIRDRHMMFKISLWTILCYSVATYFFSEPGTFSAGRLIIRMSMLVGTSYLLQNYVKELLATEDLKENAIEMAFKDALTGVYNRRMLEYLDREHEKRPQKNCLVLMDIDDFKVVNDTYGHPSGDEVLKQLAAVILKHLNDQQMCIRYGGEEFLLILGEMTDASAIELVDRIRKDFTKINYTWLTSKSPITYTAGVAFYSEGDSLYKIVRKADVALYKGKFDGKNRTIQHNSNQQSQIM